MLLKNIVSTKLKLANVLETNIVNATSMNIECAFEWSFVVIAKVTMDLHGKHLQILIWFVVLKQN
jgi:hypothetical protein